MIAQVTKSDVIKDNKENVRGSCRAYADKQQQRQKHLTTLVWEVVGKSSKQQHLV